MSTAAIMNVLHLIPYLLEGDKHKKYWSRSIEIHAPYAITGNVSQAFAEIIWKHKGVECLGGFDDLSPTIGFELYAPTPKLADAHYTNQDRLLMENLRDKGFSTQLVLDQTLPIKIPTGTIVSSNGSVFRDIQTLMKQFYSSIWRYADGGYGLKVITPETPLAEIQMYVDNNPFNTIVGSPFLNVIGTPGVGLTSSRVLWPNGNLGHNGSVGTYWPHEATLSPIQPTWIESIRNQARTVSQYLNDNLESSLKYANVDFILVREECGRITAYFCEINARRTNASTLLELLYGLLAHQGKTTESLEDFQYQVSKGCSGWAALTNDLIPCPQAVSFHDVIDLLTQNEMPIFGNHASYGWFPTHDLQDNTVGLAFFSREATSREALTKCARMYQKACHALSAGKESASLVNHLV